ncbi:hypothetical protein C5167_020441 [Papaver somniferum]|uniref:Cell wall hydroxyproline-rich glycoprotein n=1 Tax=Papaver somniferum TaxID=3469 RepID=A0A4Y7IW61_PAPSO|nr:pollen-specific leucine-rich repeat extensin-like protein 4 [Papaver somniferum]RZC52020.1 hypothetical protein C5167_020441 [Papaver somniferum]
MQVLFGSTWFFSLPFALFFFFVLLPSFLSAVTEEEASLIVRRQLLTFPENGDSPDNVEYEIDIKETFANKRLRRAYIGLQAWKKAMYSDPFNTTGNWVGPYICAYNGVFCSPALDNPDMSVVAGVDINEGDIDGYLPVELGLMNDIALFHVNSNRFCGVIPQSFSRLTILHELDLSNNRFVGPFTKVVLSIPALKYLDLRFNDFEGKLPPELFNKDLDGFFLNDNRFHSDLPENFGNSPVSVVVLANNKFTGCIPKSIGKMGNTLNEINLLNNDFAGCIPTEVSSLTNLTVFDAGLNSFVGDMNNRFCPMKFLEILDLSSNSLKRLVPEKVCKLPKLENFTFSDNFFNEESHLCVPSSNSNTYFDDSRNCMPSRPTQKTTKVCTPVVNNPVDCNKSKCVALPISSKPWSPPDTTKTPTQLQLLRPRNLDHNAANTEIATADITSITTNSIFPFY